MPNLQRPHERNSQKARGVRGKFLPILSCHSSLALRTKVTICLVFLRSVWSLLTTTNKCKLEQFQPRTLRYLSGSPYFIRNDVSQGTSSSCLNWLCPVVGRNYFSRPRFHPSYTSEPLVQRNSLPPFYVKRLKAVLDNPP